MSLSDLKFSTSSADQRPVPAFRRSPIERARAAVLASIEVQRMLLEAEENGTPANLTKTVKTVDESGNAVTATVDRKPRKWFWKNPQGKFIVEMLFGGVPVMVNGKASTIDAGNLAGVGKVLDILAEAVAKGELDKALEAAKVKRTAGRKKAA